jgi:hypothetical protein
LGKTAVTGICRTFNPRFRIKVGLAAPRRIRADFGVQAFGLIAKTAAGLSVHHVVNDESPAIAGHIGNIGSAAPYIPADTGPRGSAAATFFRNITVNV